MRLYAANARKGGKVGRVCRLQPSSRRTNAHTASVAEFRSFMNDLCAGDRPKKIPLSRGDGHDVIG